MTINNELVRQLPANVFMVAVALALSPERRVVRWWSFGAPDVLLHRQDGTWHALHSTELPMGVVPHQGRYEAGTQTLEQGETLFVMSDGVLETMCPNGEMFGQERLKQALERHAMRPEAVVGEVLDCADPGTELDDITLLRLSYARRAGLPDAADDAEGVNNDG